MGDEKLYQLPKSGLRLEGVMLSRHEGEALIADHSLGDFHEIALRSGRDSGDVSMFVFFGLLLAACGAGSYYWAWRHESALGWVVCGIGALFSLVVICAGLGTKTRWLVLKGKSGEVVYPLKDDGPVAEAFFAEIREHAQAARLIVGFRVER